MTIEEERFSHQYIIAEMYLQLLLHLGKCSLLKFFLLESTHHWFSVLFTCTKNKFILPFSILIWSSKLNVYYKKILTVKILE